MSSELPKTLKTVGGSDQAERAAVSWHRTDTQPEVPRPPHHAYRTHKKVVVKLANDFRETCNGFRETCNGFRETCKRFRETCKRLFFCEKGAKRFS